GAKALHRMRRPAPQGRPFLRLLRETGPRVSRSGDTGGRRRRSSTPRGDASRPTPPWAGAGGQGEPPGQDRGPGPCRGYRRAGALGDHVDRVAVRSWFPVEPVRLL
ncbi:MAG: hypothetical protein AVDCRST_MAG02-3840, partial [uncultured Rubrobacteraceae bacterium]